ncbi:MAG TPA: helix-turn-helix domain-containing protein [Anaerolineales bacterium]|nr:helix-turn-helix domain-containing protein [Anaerolineales bacterium]
MNSDPADSQVTTVDVGERLRILREERGLSMRSLARDSGLSTNALSMIERGRTSPSVSTLVKLAGALGAPITAFFRTEPERSNIVFRKASERTKITIPAGIYEGLGGDAFNGLMEPFILTIDPGSSSGDHDMIHTGQEFALCLEGVIEYALETQLYRLEAGDSLIFAANLRHSWHNPGPGYAKMAVVLSAFELGESPSEFHLAAA